MTSLIRFSPTADVRRMQREFDRVFNTLFPVATTDSDEAEAAVWSPRLDLVETENTYEVRLDVPGVDKEQIAVNYHDGTLSVSGERRMAELDESDECLHLERVYGRFFRSFNLPKAVEDKKISASYDSGVLHISVPKTEESKPRRITIG